MKLSKIKLLDLISNAPRSNKKKYIAQTKEKHINKRITDIDANQYNVGDIIKDVNGCRFECVENITFSTFKNVDELDEIVANSINDNDFLYDSWEEEDVITLNNIRYRVWHLININNDLNGQHCTLITKEIDEFATNGGDLLSKFPRAIYATHYQEDLSDETVFDYVGVDDVDRAFISIWRDHDYYKAIAVHNFDLNDYCYYGNRVITLSSIDTADEDVECSVYVHGNTKIVNNSFEAILFDKNNKSNPYDENKFVKILDDFICYPVSDGELHYEDEIKEYNIYIHDYIREGPDYVDDGKVNGYFIGNVKQIKQWIPLS